jgi:hypothetical protein
MVEERAMATHIKKLITRLVVPKRNKLFAVLAVAA